MNDQQQQQKQYKASSTPPPPVPPIRIRNHQLNSPTQGLAHSHSFQQKQSSPPPHPPPPPSSTYNIINNAAKLAQRSAGTVTGSIQELNFINNNNHNNNNNNLIQNVILNSAGKTYSINPSAIDQQYQTSKYDEMLTFESLNGEELIEDDETDDKIAYVLPDNKTIRGRLIITNFRLYFKNLDLSFKLDIPLGIINRIEKIGHQSSRQQNSYGIIISCKDGRRLRFANAQETRSRKQIFDTLQKYAFPISNEMSFFAYKFKWNNNDSTGWNIYNVEAEYKRMGALQDWRITNFNVSYQLCNTYPKLLVVPKDVSDDMLRDIADFRTKNRLPVLSWISSDKNNQAAIYRSSQPCNGIINKRSARDEEYLELLNRINTNSVSGKLAIMDARPKVNAMANMAKGGGYESEEYYVNSEVNFLNIQNIHVMRESLRKIFDMAYFTADDKNYFSNLENSKWIDHLKCVLVGANKIVSKVHQKRSSVLVHCSDGWDRTAQLTSLSMIMLDKYYRTIKGFEVLIEKEWLSFGHRFGVRMGHGVDKHSDQDHSPIFVQFIDCVWQIQQQHKKMFEFTEEFLIAILNHVYTCQFGTFLYNCEKEREANEVQSKTVSLWTYLNSHEHEFKNSSYVEFDGVISCSISVRTLKLWTNYYFKHKETTNEVSFNNILSSTIAPRKSFITQVVDQMKKSKHSLASEPVLVTYNRSNQPDRNIDI